MDSPFMDPQSFAQQQGAFSSPMGNAPTIGAIGGGPGPMLQPGQGSMFQGGMGNGSLFGTQPQFSGLAGAPGLPSNYSGGPIQWASPPGWNQGYTPLPSWANNLIGMRNQGLATAMLNQLNGPDIQAQRQLGLPTPNYDPTALSNLTTQIAQASLANQNTPYNPAHPADPLDSGHK